MPENQFFERKGPFPLSEIIKVIGCSGNFSPENNFKIRSFESLDNASNNDMTFLNSGKYQDLSLKTKAAACITTTNLSKFLPEKCIKLDVKNVLFAVTKVAKMFYPKADIDFPDENLSNSDDIRNLYPCPCVDQDEGQQCDEWYKDSLWDGDTYVIPPFNGSGNKIYVKNLSDWDMNNRYDCTGDMLPKGPFQ